MKIALAAFFTIKTVFVGTSAWRPRYPESIGWAQASQCRLLKTVVLVGALMPRQHAVVLPRLPSKVARILVRQGDRVKAGQALLYLDADELRLEHDRQTLVYRRAVLRARNTDLDEMQRELADIEVRDAQLALEKARRQMDDAILRAPIDGEVAQLGIRVGDFMSSSRVAGGDGIIIAGTTELIVRTEAEEFAAAEIRRGMEAEVRLGAISNSTSKAVIDAEPVIRRTGTDGRPGATFEVVALLTEPPRGQVRIGTTATVEVTSARCDNCLCAPIASVVERDGQMYVIEQGLSGPQARPVTLGISDDYQIEVRDGIAAGTTVAVGVSSDLRMLGWPTR
jgi:multidrug efflux pump subunit AcrA (membrane-fusion protein)